MSYCTIEHITARKGTRKVAELTGDPSGQAVDEAEVLSQIEDFAERMNSSIRVHYPDLPFGDDQLFLRGLNIEGAYLQLERDGDRGWTEDMRKEWKMLLDDLDGIAQGKKELRTLDSKSIKKKTDGFFTSNRRLFKRNSLSPEGVYE